MSNQMPRVYAATAKAMIDRGLTDFTMDNILDEYYEGKTVDPIVYQSAQNYFSSIRAILENPRVDETGTARGVPAIIVNDKHFAEAVDEEDNCTGLPCSGVWKIPPPKDIPEATKRLGTLNYGRPRGFHIATEPNDLIYEANKQFNDRKFGAGERNQVNRSIREYQDRRLSARETRKAIAETHREAQSEFEKRPMPPPTLPPKNPPAPPALPPKP